MIPQQPPPPSTTPEMVQPKRNDPMNLVLQAIQHAPSVEEVPRLLHSIQQQASLVSPLQSQVIWPNEGSLFPAGEMKFDIVPKDAQGKPILPSRIIAAHLDVHVAPAFPVPQQDVPSLVNFMDTSIEFDEANPRIFGRIVCWKPGSYNLTVTWQKRHPIGASHTINIGRRIALVMSGGGSLGAFQVGCLDILGKSAERNRQWPTVYGVSVGALNGAMFAMHPIGQEAEAAAELVRFWNERVRPSTIYKSWCCGTCGLHCGCCGACGQGMGLLCKRSMVNSSPLQKLIRGALNPQRLKNSDRNFTAGCVNLKTGFYEPFKKGAPGIKLSEAVLASSSFSVFFEPIKMISPLDNQPYWYTDGGVRNVLPLVDAVHDGYSEIDVIYCDPVDARRPRWTQDDEFKSLNVLNRMTEVMVAEILKTDPIQALSNQRRAIKLNILRPPTLVGSGDSLDFTPAELQHRMNMGREYAREWLDREQHDRLFKIQKNYGLLDVLICYL
eukprot:gnl/Trimastix_PCT/348.p2 GENE.gnl/Trimastix_PCT/348~~gnl/Trimastix_PCT/348.p2  ORF type:complete len:497 (-),score=134.97 gnl/Trimastix_PCT/348:1673-3163(-)